jgi:magnesium-transporting ATPase (P-type)
MSCIAKINNKTFIYSKGAPDFLLPSCTRFIGINYILLILKLKMVK